MSAKTYAEWVKSDEKTIPLNKSLAEAAWDAATNAAEEKLKSDNSDMAKCNCAGFMSVKNVLVQICGTCNGIINR